MNANTWRKPHHVYRLFDAEGRLLYIGSTVDVARRLATHRREKSWAADIATVTTEEHPRLWEAQKAERDATILEKPLHNFANNKSEFAAMARKTPWKYGIGAA